MRIVLVLATSTGGIGQHVRSLAAGLTKHGDDVLVAGPMQTQHQFDFTGVGAAFVALDGRQAVATLRRLLRASSVSVVHAHGLRAGLVAGVATPRRIPLVITWHNALLGSGASRTLLTSLGLYGARRSAVLLAHPRIWSTAPVAWAHAMHGRTGGRAAPRTTEPVESCTNRTRRADRPMCSAVGLLGPAEGV